MKREHDEARSFQSKLLHLPVISAYAFLLGFVDAVEDETSADTSDSCTDTIGSESALLVENTHMYPTPIRISPQP